MIRSFTRLGSLCMLFATVFQGLLIQASTSPEKGCTLRVDLPRTTFRGNEDIVATLIITNGTSRPVVIAKPQLPSAWSIRYYGAEPSKEIQASWEGSVVSGTTDPGHPRRYLTDQYETIQPGHAFSKALDLRWFLRNQRDNFPDGCYGLTFFYRYTPSKDEVDLPLLQSDLSSQKLQLCVRTGP